MATTSDISRGIAISFKGEIWLIVDFQFVNPGKGAAFVRTRIKNVKTGKVVEETFKSGESIDIVELDRTKVQYLYNDATTYYFMDPKSYEQIGMSNEDIHGAEAYLKEGLEVTLVMHDGVPVNLELPRKMNFKVVSAPPAVKGDTSGRVLKEVIVDNGLKIQAPLFINEGDTIVVNTETGEYVERA